MPRLCKTCGVTLRSGNAAAVDAARRPESTNALEGSTYCLRHEPPDGIVVDAKGRVTSPLRDRELEALWRFKDRNG